MGTVITILVVFVFIIGTAILLTKILDNDKK